MKKHTPSFLSILTVIVVAFTAGFFVGRNYGGAPVSLSIPEELQSPKLSVVAASGTQLANIDDELFPIDINSASVMDLTALPGIGKTLAGEIVAYRQSHGRFSHVEELLHVPGIGESRLEAILSLITVGGKE